MRRARSQHCHQPDGGASVLRAIFRAVFGVPWTFWYAPDTFAPMGDWKGFRLAFLPLAMACGGKGTTTEPSAAGGGGAVNLAGASRVRVPAELSRSNRLQHWPSKGVE